MCVCVPFLKSSDTSCLTNRRSLRLHRPPSEHRTSSDQHNFIIQRGYGGKPSMNNEYRVTNDRRMEYFKMSDFTSSNSTAIILWWRRRRRHMLPPPPLKHPRRTKSSYRSSRCYHAQVDGDNISGHHLYIISNYRNDRDHGHRHRRRQNMSCNSHESKIFALLILLLSSTASIVATHHSGRPPMASSFIPPTFLTIINSSRQCSGRSCCNKRASLFVSIQHPSSSSIGRVIGSGGVAKDIMSSFSHNRSGSNKGAEGASHSPQHHEPDGHDYDEAMPLTFQSTAFIQKLSSFSSNISRHRTARKKLSLTIISSDYRESSKDEITSLSSKEAKNSEDDALIRACTSLVYFLRDEAVALSSFSSSSPPPFDNSMWDSTSLDSIKEILEMVLIQAIRASSEVGDFVLSPKIVVAAVEYASTISQITSHAGSTSTNNTPTALLSPRIFGEAISSLSKTKASISKIKSLWNYFMYDVAGFNSKSKYPLVLSSLPSSYELNAMLSCLKERGKISAAIKLYRQIVRDGDCDDESLGSMKGDAYSASILFGMLAESIASSSRGRNLKSGDNDENQEVDAAEKVKDNKDGRRVDDYYVSPCWQWNEAMDLLETFAPSELNNFAYTALLTVNERATEEYTNNRAAISRRRHHDGVRCALLVLEKMKVSKQFYIRVCCDSARNSLTFCLHRDL